MVRLALVTSVTCRPVSCQINQVSMVPNRTSPASARRAGPGVVEQPAQLRPGEVGGQRQAAVVAQAVVVPLRASSRTSRSVRVSCQTMALCDRLAGRASHSRVVSRWLVMPIAAMSARRARRGPEPRGRPPARGARSPSRRAPPSRAGKELPMLRLVDRHDRCRGNRRRCTATTWCPGRSRRGTDVSHPSPPCDGRAAHRSLCRRPRRRPRAPRLCLLWLRDQPGDAKVRLPRGGAGTGQVQWLASGEGRIIGHASTSAGPVEPSSTRNRRAA